MLTKEQVKAFMTAMKKNGDKKPADVSYANVKAFCDTNKVDQKDLLEFIQACGDQVLNSTECCGDTKKFSSEEEFAKKSKEDQAPAEDQPKKVDRKDNPEMDKIELSINRVIFHSPNGKKYEKEYIDGYDQANEKNKLDSYLKMWYEKLKLDDEVQFSSEESTFPPLSGSFKSNLLNQLDIKGVNDNSSDDLKELLSLVRTRDPEELDYELGNKSVVDLADDMSKNPQSYFRILNKIRSSTPRRKTYQEKSQFSSSEGFADEGDEAFKKWDAEVDPELMKVVPTINKFLIDEATRISEETGKKVYPKDLIDAVLKSIEPEPSKEMSSSEFSSKPWYHMNPNKDKYDLDQAKEYAKDRYNKLSKYKNSELAKDLLNRYQDVLKSDDPAKIQAWGNEASICAASIDLKMNYSSSSEFSGSDSFNYLDEYLA